MIEVKVTVPLTCTSSTSMQMYSADDPNCELFVRTTRCMSDGTMEVEFLMSDGTTITDTGDPAVANATPYLPSSTTEVCEYAQIEDHYLSMAEIAGAATVQDVIDLALAAEAPTIGDPTGAAEAAPVDLAVHQVCAWSLNVLPCNSDVVTFSGTAVVVTEGNDAMRIGGLLATGDSDMASGGVDTTKALADIPAGEGAVSLCVTIKNCANVK